MKRYTPEELAEVLNLHGKWWRDEKGGIRANLRGADIRDANLRDANLYGANIRGADLRGANLRDANLRSANLLGADLRGANLRDANLLGANLCDANLCCADLRGANLRDANLLGADLRGANLRDANLLGADLRGTDGINIIQVGPIGSRRATTTYWIDEDRVVCGCWNDYLGGTLDEFQARVHQEHANSPRYLAEYTEAIAQFRVAREYAEPKPSKKEEV
jgi:uncharacterized protein YjbI with pentapeptide repeats